MNHNLAVIFFETFRQETKETVNAFKKKVIKRSNILTLSPLLQASKNYDRIKRGNMVKVPYTKGHLGVNVFLT